MGYYTDEINALILLSLFKEHGIKFIVASPGSTNISLVASAQNDKYFHIFSCVDERSAAYMACGISQQTGEPVVLSCTGATASRNYVSAMTEAYYRKLPIIAVTSTQSTFRVGQLMQQVIDRSNLQNDICKLSVNIPSIHEGDAEERWGCNVLINKALLECRRNGGGPVHINLATTYSDCFNVSNLPSERKISRITIQDNLPIIKKGKIAIFIGAHLKFDEKTISEIEAFCEKYDGVVLTDHNGNYNGKYGFLINIISCQDNYYAQCRTADLIIHLGEISATWPGIKSKEVWRVSEDGEVRDTFKKLTNVFEMTETTFFHYYNNLNKDLDCKSNLSYFNEWDNEIKWFRNHIPELPFSNAWLAQQTTKLLPKNSVLHLGILNSLRVWNFFDIDKSIACYSNTGGFGIDGCVSTMLGSAIASPEILHFGVVGDLAFFYDMNSIGNRHLLNNFRLIIVNNGIGFEFKHYQNRSANFGDDTNSYIAAKGHFGNKSSELIKNYAKDLGIDYLCASNKEDFLKNLPVFVSEKQYDKPIIFEIFTDEKLENAAIKSLQEIKQSSSQSGKNLLKKVLGEKNVSSIKKFLGK